MDFDTTQNIFIESDNLEALKILQKSYAGKIKMIYIDPPYNTGNDFIYHDDFSQSKKEYEIATGDRNINGELLKSFKKNSKDNGHYHSNWLNMMLPRLHLAHTLLSDDGVIFISIDDNEQAQLKLLCDEVFGGENFVATLPRQTSAQRPSQEKYISITHDYLLVYAKNKNYDFNSVIERDLSNIKKDSNGTYIEGDTSPILASSTQGYSAGGDYDIEFNGKIFKPEDSRGNRRRWLWTKERMNRAIELGIIIETRTTLRVRNYIDKEFQVGTNILVDKNPNLILTSNDLINPNYTNHKGTACLRDLLLENYFDFSKPLDLIKILAKLLNGDNSIILDFLQVRQPPPTLSCN
nr:site-specific DNA-methyltransferase [Moraxella catarrhalis]